MLPAPQRRALHAIYAFCRMADDLADDPEVGGDRLLLLQRWRSELEAAYRGESTHPVGIALGDAVQRFRLPQEVFVDLLRGVESDLVGAPIDTFQDLERYCYRVASTVGLLVVELLGCHNARALEYARVQGIAVQLVNVLRDVGQDAEAGRIYLPRQELERFGVPPEAVRRREVSESMRLLLACHGERARVYFERAESLLPPEDRHRLRPALAMGRIYRGLLKELHRRGYPCMGEPLRLSKRRRLAIAASAWLDLRRPA